MSSWFRTALMWLLVVALPMQGWAAASMVNCGPSHHDMATASAAAHEGVAPHAHASDPDSMGRHSGHPHDHDAVADASDAGVDGSQPAGTDHHSLQKLGKCSACASCCVGAALPGPVLLFDPSVPADTFVPDLSQAVTVFLTGGLERPPRSILA